MLNFRNTILVISIIPLFLFGNCSQPIGKSAQPGKRIADLASCKDTDCAEVEVPEGSIPTQCSFDGGLIESGESVTAWMNSTDESCNSETRSCNNGVLSGSYRYSSCSVSETENACIFDGMTIDHGSSVTAWRQTTNNDGSVSCSSEQRVCDNGALSGSYILSMCNEGGTATCEFSGETVPHQGMVTAYKDSSVSYGSECESEQRTCMNGILSGSFSHRTCSVGGGLNCTFNGQSYSHGERITAYAEASVPAGQTCQSQQRTCENGVFTGTYSSPSCAVDAPTACEFNGQQIPHGQSVTAWMESSVSSSQNCRSESRTCTNGSLSGSYQYASCVKDSGSSCLFNGQTVPDGSSVIAFLEASSPANGNCEYEVRMCNNGTLEGSLEHSSCTGNGVPSAVVVYNQKYSADNIRYFTPNTLTNIFSDGVTGEVKVLTSGQIPNQLTFEDAYDQAVASGGSVTGIDVHLRFALPYNRELDRSLDFTIVTSPANSDSDLFEMVFKLKFRTFDPPLHNVTLEDVMARHPEYNSDQMYCVGLIHYPLESTCTDLRREGGAPKWYCSYDLLSFIPTDADGNILNQPRVVNWGCIPR